MLEQEILRQLSDIQRSVGETTAQLSAVREELRTESQESSTYRDVIHNKLDNALMRIGKLENDLGGVLTTVEKTINPMVQSMSNGQHRLKGFMMAWGLFATIVGSVAGLFVWLFTGGAKTIFDMLGKYLGSP